MENHKNLDDMDLLEKDKDHKSLDKDDLLPGADGFVLRFTTESPEECASIIDAAVKGGALCEERTKGLYFRTVQ